MYYLGVSGYFFLFLESNKKSNMGLLKQMRQCLRKNSFFFKIQLHNKQ